MLRLRLQHEPVLTLNETNTKEEIEMIANHYVVTGKQRETRFWLKPDGLATGFRKGAHRFLTRQQAQTIADQENDSGVWGFKWVVTLRQIDAVSGEIAGTALEDLQFSERVTTRRSKRR
jgi:hypothetical protein